MWFLKKKKRDVIDFTEMEKRGILERVRKTQSEIKPSSEYKDLSGSENTDLFSAIASSSGSSGESIKTPSSTTAIANKLDDIEFKLEHIRKKVDDIMNRLEVLERKASVYRSS